jgi:hypothetical protein
MDPIGTLFDIVVSELGKRESTSPLARHLRVALIGYYGGFFGALLGALATWRGTILLGISPSADGLALFAGALIGGVLGFLGGSPVGSLTANAILRHRRPTPQDRWLIIGGFLGGLVASIIIPLAFLLG